MGLRRRLSKKWNETVNGVLSGPGVDVDSVNTVQASIGGDRVERLGPQQRVVAGIRDGLVGHWTLNNLSDGLQDTVNGNDIETFGSPSVITNGGAFGDGVKFGDGSNYGKIPHSGELSVETDAFTILCYCRVPFATDTNNPSMIVHKRGEFESDTSLSYAAAMGARSSDGFWNNGRVAPVGVTGDGSNNQFAYGQSDRLCGEGPLYAFALTYDPSDGRGSLWINGRSRGTGTLSPSPVNDNDPVWVGTKLDGSGNVAFDGAITLSDLRIYDRKLRPSEIKTHASLAFPESPDWNVTRKANVVSGSNFAGPVFRYDEGKTDAYRLLCKDYSSSGNPVNLYATNDPEQDISSWTTVATDIISGYTNASDTEPSDYVYDGSTYWVYMTDQNARDTVVFSGSDWSTLSFDSTVLDDEDIGSFRDADGTVYLYSEDGDFQSGVGSQKIALWTASSANGSFSEQRSIIDLSDYPWKAGDPDIEFIDGDYWMFLDNTQNHPHYGTSILRSSNLYDWELLAEDVKQGKGGDLDVTETPDGLLGMTELSGEDTTGIDLWDVAGPL